MKKESDRYFFSDEKQTTSPKKESWHILIINEKKIILDVFKKSIKKIVFENKKITLLAAKELHEAEQILQNYNDIVVIFLNYSDQKTGGLNEFLNTLKSDVRNKMIRIILLADDVNSDLQKEFNIEYFLNTKDLDPEIITTTILLALHSYKYSLENTLLQQKLEETYAAEARFVPRKFLELLQKETIRDIKISDFIAKEMSILFLDVRSFSSFSEFLMPQEMFEFINDCLSYLNPFIEKNNGFIDKYIGDAIMALFPDNADNAILAANDMLKSLEDLNYNRILKHKIPIKIGIGINTGQVALGAVGNFDRMECTVLGNAVNKAARIEKVNKIFGTTLVISEKTLTACKNPSQFNCRSLGKMTVAGIKEYVPVIEIFDSDPPEVKNLKIASKNNFEKAVQFYKTGDFIQAKQMFMEIVNENRQDSAAKAFLTLCEKS